MTAWRHFTGVFTSFFPSYCPHIFLMLHNDKNVNVALTLHSSIFFWFLFFTPSWHISSFFSLVIFFRTIFYFTLFISALTPVSCRCEYNFSFHRKRSSVVDRTRTRESPGSKRVDLRRNDKKSSPKPVWVLLLLLLLLLMLLREFFIRL